MTSEEKITKIMGAQLKYKVTCECGTRIYIPPIARKKICKSCGRLNYSNKKIEFEEKMRRKLR